MFRRVFSKKGHFSRVIKRYQSGVKDPSSHGKDEVQPTRPFEMILPKDAETTKKTKVFGPDDPLYIYSASDPRGKHTTEHEFRLLEEAFGGPPVPYTSRYPDVSVEQMNELFDKEIARLPKETCSEALWDIVGEHFPQFKTVGEFNDCYKLEDYDITMIDERSGYEIPHYKNLMKYAKTPTLRKCWEKMYEMHREVHDRYWNLRQAEDSVERIDWDSIEKILGEDVLAPLREKFNRTVTQNKVQTDFGKVSQRLYEYYLPVREESKDMLLDLFPKLKICVDTVIDRAPLLELDEYGLPPDYFSFQIIDKYYPDFRDAMFLEVENDNFDYRPPKDLKRWPISSMEDATLWINEKYWKNKDAEHAEMFKSILETNTSKTTSNTQRVLAQLFEDVKNIVEKNKKLEGEISQMRTSLEELSGGLESEGKKTAEHGSTDVAGKVVAAAAAADDKSKVKLPYDPVYEKALASGEFNPNAQTGGVVKGKIAYNPDPDVLF